MTGARHIVVIGAGIVGVSAAIWLRRAGCEVTLIDRAEPGQGTSFGNAGVLASCSVVPVTGPGMALKGPKLLFDPNFPLFLRWSYLPRLAPWLMRYLRHANDSDTRRIAAGLTPIVSDSVDQHKALNGGGAAEGFMTSSDYSFAYADRAAFEADAYVWELRKIAGFEPQIVEGETVREVEPAFGSSIGLLAVMRDHGFITDPGAYVAALADTFKGMGGRLVTAQVQDFDLGGGTITAVETDQGRFECDAAIMCTGVWSKPLAAKLGLNVPLETERGYHIVFKQPSIMPASPVMVASGKFVATPMDAGLRCAGIVEFGGLDAGPSKAPLKLLRRQVKKTFPEMTFSETEEWLGHRPAPADSLPLIGEIGGTGVYTAFGHHHIGLTGGPKTGRLVAGLVSGERPNIDLSAYDPNRF
ncbi:NAD(P)/FAD-dependent oxidoreductase [Hoeflea prorocentri]|uniref:FAD-dependent oxidoreductase n=1 Tax=Hoeflea prorocentri TaxID=1922333 RepID=A0A9X3ZFR8_9HYPH|nr:FAD-dependent oxidoreductase [Hoeflea prorocentri]MCY6379469.1 FAD-dependent oxidoreductase [Hoeflea prorocentri]MDA5397269.1 FAD-dependent oxidoreductase [Hoeflea prorocentri]